MCVRIHATKKAFDHHMLCIFFIESINLRPSTTTKKNAFIKKKNRIKPIFSTQNTCVCCAVGKRASGDNFIIFLLKFK